MMTIDMFDTAAAPASLRIDLASPDSMDDVIGVLARGMRDNPLHVAAFGTDPMAREWAVRRMFGLGARKSDFFRNMRVARGADGRIVGVYGFAVPGKCQPTTVQRILTIPTLLTLGVGNVRRVGSLFGTWARHDPQASHWHFGPIAVDAGLQGQGIGSAMMRDFCARMDAERGTAYLETDKEINVGFYRKFGFEVIAEDDVLGVRNWFMLRQPAGA